MKADQELPLPTPPVLRSHNQMTDEVQKSQIPVSRSDNKLTRGSHASQSTRTNTSLLPDSTVSISPVLPSVRQPGVRHDYTEMARQSEELRKQVMDSRVGNIMTTVQAIHITYPVADFRGEAFACT